MTDLFLRGTIDSDGPNDVRLFDDNFVRLSQQYLEVVESGSNNLVRLSQQYLEVPHSGSNNKVRLSQQYLEVVHHFGDPVPQSPGKSKDAPGKNKPPKGVSTWQAFVEREKRHRNRRVGRFRSDIAVFQLPAYVPPGTDREKIVRRTIIKTVKH